MEYIRKQAVICGGGPAGLAAAVRLHKAGIRDIIILEREPQLGGILRQCIHDGFGLVRFRESLSGPEYAQRFIDQVEELGIDYLTKTTVLEIAPDRKITAVSAAGIHAYDADSVVLAMGCRERTRGALSIPGERPSGVYTAGVAQAYMNLKNTMVGKNIVILGSGDIGMIMARRFTLEGARVNGVYEILPYPSGLPRNTEQCLHDYHIPLHLSHTVTKIIGRSRLKAVEVSQVDSLLRPLHGTERMIPCDTLILSVGLIPENELTRKAGAALDPRTRGAIVDEYYQTSIPGVFSTGNVLHVHDLVDFVSLEAESLADSIGDYLSHGMYDCPISIQTGDGVGYTVPQRVSGKRDATVFFRVKSPVHDCRVQITQGGIVIADKQYKKLLPAKMERIKLPAASLVSNEVIKVGLLCD